MVDVHELITAKLAERDAEWEEQQRLEQLAPGVKPSVLARNLIRCGLSLPADDALSTVVDRVDAAMEELRALVP